MEFGKIIAIYARASEDSDASLAGQEMLGIAYSHARGQGHRSYLDLCDGHSINRPGLNGSRRTSKVDRS